MGKLGCVDGDGLLLGSALDIDDAGVSCPGGIALISYLGDVSVHLSVLLFCRMDYNMDCLCQFKGYFQKRKTIKLIC